MNVVMIGGGKGGVGKSSVAAGLARQISQLGHKVGIIDADLSGPSQSILFSCGPMPIVNGAARPTESVESISVASIGLIARQDTALVWSDSTAAAAVRFLTAPDMWLDHDTLLIDLPPGQGRITTELAQIYAHAECVLVTTGSDLALEQCRRAAAFLRKMELRITGIVENMAFSRCPHCGSEHSLFEADETPMVAEELDVPLLARLAFSAEIEAGNGLEGVARAVVAGGPLRRK
jgi:ATP-binding protein involved in chromosome partitioning